MVKVKKRVVSVLLTVCMLVSAVYAAIPASAAITDVKSTDWYYEAVQFNKNNNMIADLQNYNANNPAPRKDVTYALYKLVNGKDSTPTDVGILLAVDTTSLSNDYKYSVQWCMKNGIINGTKTEGYKTWFSPESIITREQMAAILYRTAEYKGLDTKNYSIFSIYGFNDEYQISSWAYDSIAWCVSNGLMNGTGNNNLSPKNTLTFAQLAQFMVNFDTWCNNNGSTETPTPTPTPNPSSGVNYYNLTPHPENADISDWLLPEKAPWGNDIPGSDYCSKITDLSGPWDNVTSLKDQNWLPIGGYMKDGHRYNAYNVCIDEVDGIPTDEEKRIFIAINQHRVNNGSKPLEWDQGMQAIAEIRAIETVNYFDQTAHMRPNSQDYEDTNAIMKECNSVGILRTKQSIDNWMNECLVHAQNASTLAYGYCVDSWINSPGHNAAIKDINSTYGAVARANLDNKDVWCYNAIQTN